MATEARRKCGFRKVGGLYLVSSGEGVPCDRLPIPLNVCPCCSQGIKQSRGWTWLNIHKLVGHVHENCRDFAPSCCPLCSGLIEKAGLLWIGEKFYSTTHEFCQEAAELGISRRISAIPRDFKVGETWVLLAHPKAVDCPDCKGYGLTPVEDPKDAEKCPTCGGDGRGAGIFYVCRPNKIEKIITQTQSQDAEVMADLERRGITPVIVPDDDKDHQGTVYDRDPEPESPAPAAAADIDQISPGSHLDDNGRTADEWLWEVQ